MQTDGIKKWKLKRAPKSHWSNIPQYDMTATSIGPVVDKKTGHPKTGLTKEQEREFEDLLHLNKGELSNRSSWWLDFIVKVGGDTLILDMDEDEDALAFYFLKGHPKVAFGHDELKKNSKAVFVLYNDVDQAKQIVRSRNVKKEAYAKFNEMDTQEQVDVLMVMGEKIVSHDPYIVESMMGRVVEKSPAQFLEIAGDDNFKLKLFVMKCVHFDILTRSRGRTLNEAIISFGNDVLGEGIDAVVEVLRHKTNQKLYLALDKRLETAMAAGTLAGAPIMTGYEIEEALQTVPTGSKKANTERGKIKTTSTSKGVVGGANTRLVGTEAGKNQVEADAGRINEVTGDGLDSGSYEGEAPEVIL
jgi:hypothetical protein